METQTDEHVEARRWMREAVGAVDPRARVIPDPEGWPIVPGRLGQVEWAGDRDRLCAYTDRRGVIARLLAVRGVTVRQRGDAEVRVEWLAGAAVTTAAVLGVLRARRRRVVSPETAARLAAWRLARA